MKIIARLSIFLIILSMFMVRCANQGSPTGGLKDTIAPYVVRMTPAMYTTNFKGKKIFIEFNEYVQLKDQSKLFFVSPPGTQKPRLTIKGRGVEVLFETDLDSATTYRVDFGSSIVDNNESNKLDGFSYVFSTGSYIDSLMMVGQVTSAFERDTVVNSYIYFFDPKSDSSKVDSTLFNGKVEALFRTDSLGYFVADILKDKEYRLYAIDDKNGDQKYQAGADRVGFIDGTYNPAKLGEFGITYDSTQSKIVKIDPVQVRFELFAEIPVRRQLITKQSRPERHKIVMTFNSPNPEIDSIMLEGIEPSWLIQEKGAIGDTITLWIAPPTKDDILKLVDTIRGTLKLQRQDSVWTTYSSTEKLTFSHRIFDPEKVKAEKKAAQLLSSKAKKAEKLKAKQAKKAAKLRATQLKRDAKLRKRGLGVGINDEGRDSLMSATNSSDSLVRAQRLRDSLAASIPVVDSIELKAAIADSIAQAEANKLKYKVVAANPLIPQNDIVFVFENPIRTVDSTKIELIHIQTIEGKGRNTAVDTTKIVMKFDLKQNPENIHSWKLSAPWIVDQEYTLQILAGAFEDITFAVNDSLGSKFKIASPDKFAEMTFKPTSDPVDSSLYVYELLKSGGKSPAIVSRKIGIKATESVTFSYLAPGNYMLRIFQDVNGNGKWDTGSLTERRQPEKARIIADDQKRHKTFVAKENWSVEEVVNLIELFR